MLLKNKVAKKRPTLDFNIAERKFLMGIVDFIIIFFSLNYYIKNQSINLGTFNPLNDQLIYFVYGIGLYLILSLIFNLYNLNYANKTRRILPATIFVSLLFSTIYILTPVLTPLLPNQRVILLFFVLINVVGLSVWRILYAHFFNHSIFLKRIIILVSDDFSKKKIKALKRRIEGKDKALGYQVKKIYTIPSNKSETQDLANMLNQVIQQKLIDDIVLLDSNHNNISADLNNFLLSAIRKGINVQTYLKLYEDLYEALPLKLAGKQFYNIFPISRYNANYAYQLWNRTIDILSAFVGLFVMIVLIPFILLLNLFFNKGPLFYSQKRVGKEGVEYKVLKFRSMVVHAEKNGAAMAQKDDARITAFGKVIRKFRIDELPQFWCVLKGDMSLIGPRPERQVFVTQIAEQITHYNIRHLIKPGITGWAQVMYPYGENLEDSYNKLEYDLYYIKNRSVTLDLRILIKTINTIIFSKGM